MNSNSESASLHFFLSAAILKTLPETAAEGASSASIQSHAQSSVSHGTLAPSHGTSVGLTSSINSHNAPTFSSSLPPAATPVTATPNLFGQASLAPALASLAGRLAAELESKPERILTLNPSRREALRDFLRSLSGQKESDLDATAELKRLVSGPRTQAQTQALRTYFEEVSWLTLGQALVLKAWSDRGEGSWTEADLGKINWALSTRLRPNVPLDREGWQITSRNLYSWYTPEPQLQAEIWQTFSGLNLADEGPELLAGLLKLPHRSRQQESQNAEDRGYDSRFFQVLWDLLPKFASRALKSRLSSSDVRIFSPTLRNGAMVRSAPNSFQWIGFEKDAYSLLAAELIQLWWGPASPPVWAHGTGLEAHSRDQLALTLGSPKPGLIQRIAELEACEAAVVLEERCIRPSQKTQESQALKAQLETLPYFKKIKNHNTSLGMLQACVALTKLRPGGALLWLREEPLLASEGPETYRFLLEKGLLMGEWNLATLEHHLPSNSPLYPKYLYLWIREPEIEPRHSHHPARVRVSGSLRSHIEVPHLLSEAIESVSKMETSNSWSKHSAQITLEKSPSNQKEWAERWPDPAGQEILDALEVLRVESIPLGKFAAIRAHTIASNQVSGFDLNLVQSDSGSRGPGLYLSFDTEGKSLLKVDTVAPTQNAFWVGLSDASLVSSLQTYFESERIQQWVKHFAESRGARQVLTEALIKFLPVPKTLVEALQIPHVSAHELGLSVIDSTSLISIQSEAEKLIQNAKQSIQELALLPLDVRGKRIRAHLFVEACRRQEELKRAQSTLFDMVTENGQIHWRAILEILPPGEVLPAAVHPWLKLQGMIPPFQPIGRIDRVKMPTPGVLLSHESGRTLLLSSDHPRILEILWSQMGGLSHPTWNELSQYLKLPRRLDLAETTASDVLMAHAEETSRLKVLKQLASVCQSF